MNKLIKYIFLNLIVAGFCGLVVAAESRAGLIEDFGGKSGLVKVVDDFMIGLLAEPKTKASFINADQKHIKEMLVDQFCELLDGPCKYTGKSMAKSHAGLGVDKSQFYALVECLRTAMSKNNVPVRSQNKLLAKLAPMNRDIIEK